MKWNATVARRHSLRCDGIDIGKRMKLMENSQSSKHNRVVAGLFPSPGSTVGGETMFHIHQQATKANSLSNHTKELRNGPSSHPFFALPEKMDGSHTSSITTAQAN